MNVLLRVSNCRVLEMMKKDPGYAKKIGLTDASKVIGTTSEKCKAAHQNKQG